MINVIMTALLAGLLVGISHRYLKLDAQRIENEMLEASMNEMMLLYQQLQYEIEATRRFRHDLSKHITTLEYVLETRASESIKTTYDEMRASYDKLIPQYSRHEIINSVLMIKDKECTQKGLHLTISVTEGDVSQYKEVDLVGLLYNLLDNAIEAASHTTTGRITMAIDMKDHLKIHLENDYQPSYKARKDPRRHGIGLLIINDIVKRTHGEMTTRKDDYTVIQDVTLGDPDE